MINIFDTLLNYEAFTRRPFYYRSKKVWPWSEQRNNGKERHPCRGKSNAITKWSVRAAALYKPRCDHVDSLPLWPFGLDQV
ncbi:uncharacterized protein LACBIDRAFT_303970 [Laccaria bicolor S238N-H82]|uniref:Predicted protein n=1 Tax=Laccaria bicolor (strain S238N-H82 / ATCC MYA-4686) TaxID=486041 RepID=B0DKN2_LACBS|nr:uncharacterized protein LACBIDRAFT_303970 [Laccaria bicolor S238N-H82]EDR04674.1 predicted protein [Laccaria bicolor S238N-H82]|eukprot:XP_001884498.1 predicted protein [Laccaria bicolor S238N-H82]